ncbi:hypothetical protein ZYGR_0N03800 [Zygosaccharomyces rouxii]|uniref:Uridine kinase n=1 Tax=Zygosaccharomyces rouxii TaxID=4956 RepID=A0A1Q2ZZU1_ZYGRO|nr:hypothetical protein ZYGR_0N03800 [Zygosaccharomyces rouxii]
MTASNTPSPTILESTNVAKVHHSDANGHHSKSKRFQYLPPWTTPYVIGVGGPSGSGKTSVAAKIVSSLNVPWTVLISLDNFYKPLNAEQRRTAFENNYDFDHPTALDLDLAYEAISSLKEGKKTTIPVYSFVEHNRIPNKNITIYGASIIVLEGIYTLYDKRLLDLMDLKIYVDADLDVCLARRLSRDIVYRGRDLEGCLEQWERFVKPNAERYLRPKMKEADAIVPSLTDNGVAVELIINHIKSRLQQKSEEHLKELIELGHSDLVNVSEHPSLHELVPTNQVNAIITMLLNKMTSRYDFVFYFDRIATILLTQVLSDIPVYEKCTIETPEGTTIPDALKCDFNQITAINLIESGDCFMHSLKKTIPNIVTGKLLVQSDSRTGEPQLHFELLPPDITNYKMVLLTEAQMISGASMIMSTQVLLDHGVELENIKVVVFLATEISIRRILNAFDGKVDIYVGKIVTKNELNRCDWAKARFVGAKYFGW